MANPNYGGIVATTIENRRRTLRDNLSKNNALLDRLRRRGNVDPISGGSVILEEILYDDGLSTGGAYSGYDVIDITPRRVVTAAQFPIKQYAEAVSMSGTELLQNSGRERVIDLLTARISAAEMRLVNQIGADIFGDGTGYSGKAISGLGSIVSTTPTSGVVGGIDRATNTWWQNKEFNATVDGGEALDATNIQQYMNQMAISLIRGRSRPDLIVAGNDAYEYYLNSLQAIQRITDDNSAAGSGFPSLKYYGGGVSADVILGGGIGGPENPKYMYFLNTEFLYFRPHRERDFVTIGEGNRESVNQDAIVRLIGWAGNLTTSGPQFMGVLWDND